MKHNFNILIISNQNASLFQLNDLLIGAESAFILTTHKLFNLEVSMLQCPVLKVHTFADFLSDAEMEEIDNNTTRLLHSMEVRSDQYNDIFMQNCMKEKNRIVKKKLLHEYSFQHIYYFNGLGISRKVWAEDISHELEGIYEAEKALPVYCRIKNKIREKIIYPIADFTRKRTIYIFEDNSYYYIFTNNIKRLDLDLASATHFTITYIYLIFIIKRLFPFNLLLDKFLRKKLGANRLKFCTSMHCYSPDFQLQTGISPYVFVDAHLPSNYPRSYLDSFNGSTFVPDSFISQKWPQKHQKPCVTPPGFVRNKIFKSIKCPEIQISNIFLMINHAGDWSATINRSDTDIIVEEFASLALYFPEYNFILRPHPTMAHPNHEGRNAIDRLSWYTSTLKLPNLKISSDTFENDLSNANIILSEYSQALLSAYEKGIPALIVNLTNRRSYMQDFVDIGFVEINDKKTLHEGFSRLPDFIHEIIQKNNQAIEQYNSLQIAWRTRK